MAAAALTVTGTAFASYEPSTVSARAGAGSSATDAPQPSLRGYATLFATNGGPSKPTIEADYQPVNLGVAFRSSTDGSLAGLRMFRAPGETAAHPATVWTSSGDQIGRLTFPAASTSGWQSALFTEPVGIDADTTYVVSYFTSTGYATTHDFFSATPKTRGTLTTLPYTDTSHNGLYSYAPTSAAPTSSWHGSNYWIDVLATSTPGGGNPTSGAPTSPSDPTDPTDPTDPPTSPTSPTSPPSSPPATSPTPPTSTPPTSTPPSSGQPGGTKYVLPGQVGFTGDRSALKVVPDDGVPTGCTWMSGSGSLECRDNAVIDHMYVKGGVDAYADITITNSVIAAQPTNWLLVNLRSAGGTCSVTHSTLTFANGGHMPNGFTTWGVGGINDMRGCHGTFADNDISGTPDGIDTGSDNTVIKDNYIHDLATIGEFPQNTHNDGVQLFGCSGCTISGNYFDIGWDGEHQNSCFFESDGDIGHGIVFTGNYLSGGGYAFRNIIGIGMVVTDNTFHELPDQYGLTLTGLAATFAGWTGNVTTTGQTVTQPTP